MRAFVFSRDLRTFLALKKEKWTSQKKIRTSPKCKNLPEDAYWLLASLSRLHFHKCLCLFNQLIMGDNATETHVRFKDGENLVEFEASPATKTKAKSASKSTVTKTSKKKTDEKAASDTDPVTDTGSEVATTTSNDKEKEQKKRKDKNYVVSGAAVADTKKSPTKAKVTKLPENTASTESKENATLTESAEPTPLLKVDSKDLKGKAKAKTKPPAVAAPATLMVNNIPAAVPPPPASSNPIVEDEEGEETTDVAANLGVEVSTDEDELKLKYFSAFQVHILLTLTASDNVFILFFFSVVGAEYCSFVVYFWGGCAAQLCFCK